MALNTGVDWADNSWPIITGCDLESPGCIHCYAINDSWRLSHNPNPKVAAKYAGLVHVTRGGELAWTGKINFHEPSLLLPLSWTKPARIFLTPEGDLYHNDVTIEELDQIHAVATLAHWHDFQILSKRSVRMALYYLDPATPKRIARAVIHLVLEHKLGGMKRLEAGLARVTAEGIRPWPLPNLWLVSSVEDQKRADLRREPMRRLSAAGWITGMSYEPALEQLDLAGWEFLDWLVSGGESGKKARFSPPQLHRVARDFCARHDIAYTLKQHGVWLVGEYAPGAPAADTVLFQDGYRFEAKSEATQIILVQAEAARDLQRIRREFWASGDGRLLRRVGKKKAGRLLDGVLHDAYPARAQTTRARAEAVA